MTPPLQTDLVSPKGIIREHISDMCDLLINHPIIVDGHINAERALTNDYMGRALYELLQNAVDRAEKNIWITLNEETRSLTVANDGSPLGLKPKLGEELSDFGALCSVHTSNKQPGGSIGNKGVGFKSIWEFCRSVQIRSLHGNNRAPWGFRLRFPFQYEHLEGWVDRKLTDNVFKALAESKLLKKNKGQAPSFYFPEFLDDPTWHHPGAVTAIELEEINEKNFKKLAKLLDELTDSPLMFVGDIRPDQRLSLQIKSPGTDPLTTKLFVDDDKWIRITPDLSDLEEELEKAMEDLGFELEDGKGNARPPRVSMIFPKDGQLDYSGLIHSYLPTKVKIFAPMHIQGDFYLSESRKQIDFDDNDYNKKLLNRVVDTLLDAIAHNQGGLAEQPYALKLLSTNGELGTLIKERLEGNGKRLSDLFVSILNHTPDNRKTVKLYKAFFHQISHFIPPKTEHFHDTHLKQVQRPYLSSFCRDDLPIVPVKYDTKKNEDTPRLIQKACSLPLPTEKVSESKAIFCKRSLTNTLDPINLADVVITSWIFGPDDVASAMRKLHIWQEYEQVSLLRTISRVQKEANCNSDRSRLLVEALKITAPENDRSHTRWRFLDLKEIYPSARLLVPVEGETHWAEARYVYMPDEQGFLDHHIDQKLMHRIDHNRCLELLGNNYRNNLLTIGVWDCIPLIKKQHPKEWTMPLSHLPSELGSLALFSRSYWIWKEATHQNIEPVVQTLATSPWLIVDSGSTEPVAPASTFLGATTGQALGYFLFSPDGLSDHERDFLRSLGVRRLDETSDIDKLIDVAKALISNSHDGKSLRPVTVKTYRALIRRINELLLDKKTIAINPKFGELPLLYEDNNHERGIAGPLEIVWYVPGSQNKVKAKLTSTDTKWWLVSNNAGTLASRLTQVSTLNLQQRLETQGSETSDSECYKRMEQAYLPRFFALATYGDIGSIPNSDEDTIQIRWQGLSILRVEHATLIESVEGMGSETTTKLQETGLLWESVSSGRSKNLKLYVAHDCPFESEKTQRHLCQWFAEEIFRQRGLAIYFERLILNEDLSDFGVADSDIKETQQLINSWLPDQVLDQLLDELRPLIGDQLTRNNWRNISLYLECRLRFDELQKFLPSQQMPLIECLNPVQSNLDRFAQFLDEHQDQIAALPDNIHRDNDAWIKLLSNNPERYSFDFSPEDWLVKTADISQGEFEKLIGKLAALENELLTEKEANSTPVTAIPEIASISTGNIALDSSHSVSLVDIQDDHERTAQSLNNSRSGKNLEQRVAITASRKAYEMDSEMANRFFSLISAEYSRFNKLDELPSKPPSTEKGWLKLLHIGGRWDGAGYDLLDYAETDDKLLLVEVKSSRSHSPEIHFSEPERRNFLDFGSDDFKGKHPDHQWRLFLGTPDSYIDITGDFIKVVKQHSLQFESIEKNPAPDGWVLRNIQIEKL